MKPSTELSNLEWFIIQNIFCNSRLELSTKEIKEKYYQIQHENSHSLNKIFKGIWKLFDKGILELLPNKKARLIEYCSDQIHKIEDVKIWCEKWLLERARYKSDIEIIDHWSLKFNRSEDPLYKIISSQIHPYFIKELAEFIDSWSFEISILIENGEKAGFTITFDYKQFAPIDYLFEVSPEK